MSEINKFIIIARLRKEIENSGMTLKELSEKAEIPIRTLRRYMKKDVLPTVKYFFNLCCVLNLSADAILGYRPK